MPGYEVSCILWTLQNLITSGKCEILLPDRPYWFWYFGGVGLIASFEALAVGFKSMSTSVSLKLSQYLAHLCTSFLSIRGLPCMLQLKEPVLK